MTYGRVPHTAELLRRLGTCRPPRPTRQVRASRPHLNENATYRSTPRRRLTAQLSAQSESLVPSQLDGMTRGRGQTIPVATARSRAVSRG